MNDKNGPTEKLHSDIISIKSVIVKIECSFRRSIWNGRYFPNISWRSNHTLHIHYKILFGTDKHMRCIFDVLHTINHTVVIKLSKIYFSHRLCTCIRSKESSIYKCMHFMFSFCWVCFSSYHFRRALELISSIISLFFL